MKVLELFSGIGGMHFGLKAIGEQPDVMAVEINPVANAVYRHNFPKSKLIQKNILSLSAEEINKFEPECLLMSPPCQPFTRVGLNKDLDDRRTDPLKYIITLLPELVSLNYVLVENVKGFETSKARDKLISCLQELNFDLREFLLSPTQFKVPNSRTRFYLLARRKPLAFSFEQSCTLESMPEAAVELLNILEKENKFSTTSKIADILETDDVNAKLYKEHLLPSKVLEKRIKVMDIVSKEAERSCCFTKAYGRYIEGTGSFLCSCDQSIVDNVLSGYSRDKVNMDALRSLHLRFFTPKEVARLMSFPECFQFPQEITQKQKYKLLGNSINVKVVSLLIKLMLYDSKT